MILIPNQTVQDDIGAGPEVFTQGRQYEVGRTLPTRPDHWSKIVDGQLVPLDGSEGLKGRIVYEGQPDEIKAMHVKAGGKVISDEEARGEKRKKMIAV